MRGLQQGANKQGKKPMKWIDRHQNVRRRAVGGMLLLSAAAAATVSALAQDAPAAGSASGGEEEIIVTAQKRRQALKDVPAAVTALTSKTLDDRVLNTVEDISTSVPNLQFTSFNGVTIVAIRGIAPEANSPSVDSSTAQHIDGVYQPRPTSMNLAMADLDSVEVLRGPQGTLYGRNATAGVINFILKRPGDELAAGVETTVGNYGRRKISAYVTGPVAEGLNARISALFDRNDGYGINLLTNKRVGGEDTEGVRAALEYTGLEGLNLYLSAYYVDSTIDGPNLFAFTPLTGPDVAAHAPESLLQTTRPRRVYSDFDAETRTKQGGVTGIVDVAVTDNISIKSISGYVDSDFHSLFDTAPLPVLISWGEQKYTSEMFSQEFNLNAKLFDRLDTVVGLYYMEENFDQAPDVHFPQGFLFNNIRTPFVVRNILNEDTTSKAIFADATYSITDDFRILGGIRYTEDEKEVEQSIFYGALTFCNSLPGKLSYSSTTGRAGVQYDVSDSVTAYATWQSGFKAGGFNVSGCGDDFDPEELDSYEIGIKGTLFDRRVTFALSGFHYDAKNFQVVQLVQVNGLITSRVENAAGANITGLELEATARLTDHLKIDINATYTDSEYKDYTAFNSMTRQFVDLDGYQLMKTPEYTFKLGVDYDFVPVDGFLLTLRGEVYHSAKIFYTPFHDAIAAQNDAFTIVNAFATLEPDEAGYRISLFGKNIFGEDYRISGNTSPAYNVGRGYWNDPATYGVTIAYDF